ncbi:hypothetical protein [Brevundimonas sp.]|uniref:CC_3452 family protein n=1 Tax=Brevundimonas sp. TaxID=1871086 RepID=UPI002737DD19|nr:hypothetical protein [Brevundimonas sp.]MDP3800855.1 hypothetical protein [Brevundimonas sp.]
MRALLIAAALFAAAPAFAQAPNTAAATSAVLADAARAPAARTIIDGASWNCDGASCTANGGANQPATRACRRVVARFGAVSSFSYKGVALTAEQLAACNA